MRSRSLSRHWAMGACCLLLLLLFWSATPTTQARFISKRETPKAMDIIMGANVSTADPDIVNPSSESANGSSTTENSVKSVTEVEPVQKLVLIKATTEALEQKHNNNTSELQEEATTTEAIKLQAQENVNGSLKALNIKTKPAEEKLAEATKDLSSFSTNDIIQNVTTEKIVKTTTATPTIEIQEQLTPQLKQQLEVSTLPTPVTTTTTEATKALLASTLRSEDHARSMQLHSSSTESYLPLFPVTPMKLRPLMPMTRTKTTQTPQLLAALLHAGVTVTPNSSSSMASQENAIIEEDQLKPQLDKRAKFISDNSTNAQQLTLPNGAEVWSLAAMKMVPTTTSTTTMLPMASNATELANDIEPQQNQTEQHKEKNLLDWQQIMLMQTMSHENHTEPMMSTTLDATEAATQATTSKLDEKDMEMETAASSAVIATTVRQTTTTDSSAINEIATTTTTQAMNAKLQLASAETEVTATVTSKPALTELPMLNITEAEENASVKPALTEFKTTETETATTTTTTIIPPAALPTAVPELPTTTTSEATTTLASALNGTPNANEMAMKATTAHENNETADKSNNVDDNDVIKVSANVSVNTSTEQTTLASIERQPITVSTRTAGEVNTTTTSTSSTGLLHAKVDEQLETTTTTIIISLTTTSTPTPTEIVQISNEVNLPIKNVTQDNIIDNNNNNLQTSEDNNNLLITNSAENINNSAVIANSQTPLINNSVTEQINNSSNPITITTPTTLLTDGKANSKLNEEHETLLETNNIGETAAITTTTIAPVNALDESTATTREATTTTTTAATLATAVVAKGSSELYDNDNDDNDDDDEQQQQQIEHDNVTEQQLLSKTNMATTEAATTTTTTTNTTARATTTTSAPTTTTTAEQPLISLLDDSTTTTTTTTTEAVTTTTTTTTSTAKPTTTTTTTTTEPIYSSTADININNNINIRNNSNSDSNMIPTTTVTVNSANVDMPTTTTMLMPPPHITGLDHMQQPHGNTGTDVNVIIAITVSVIGVVALILLVAFLYLMRKRQKQTSYGQRCRPVSLDAYSLDNVSVLGSVRRKGRDLRASKRTYGNAAFDDPSLRHNLLSATELGKFVERRSSIFEEFRDVPQIIARADEVPAGCEDKNRYANVIPLPETRVVLQRQGDDDKTEYINANYVRGPRDAPNYYIACQAPLETTTGDFWRMIWEQQSRVIVQATDLNENGIERCAEYLPPSVTLDNHSSYGDYQVTLKHREVKDKYAISTLMLKHVDGNESRELTHYWYKWPEVGVPVEEAPIIAMLLEARSSLKSYALEQANELKHEKSSTLTLKSLEGETKQVVEADAEKCSTSSAASNEINGNVANKTSRSQQGPLTIHCSPGTGRTGTIIACDMAIRSLETPKRSVDIPQLVYYVRRGRASAVQTKEQYEFIYKVANMYATKITNMSNDN